MNIKTLLLGTAAALAVGGVAQAADLAVAVSPVEYVKVCDAFGSGYQYIPGTDTCLKISGYVKFDAFLMSQTGTYYYGASQNVTVPDHNPPTGNGLPGTYPVVTTGTNAYTANWYTKTEAGAEFKAQTMSDMGPIVTYFKFIATTGLVNSSGNANIPRTATLDKGWVQIGPLLFGYAESIFDVAYGAQTYGGDNIGDSTVDQATWAYSMGTWGIMASLEDPRVRWKNTATGDMPDILAAITGSAGAFNWKAAVAVTDRTRATGWGAMFNAWVDLGGGSSFGANVGYSQDAAGFVTGSFAGTGIGHGYGDWWGGQVTGKLAVSSNVAIVADLAGIWGPGMYVHSNSGPNVYNGKGGWFGALGVQWYPTSNSELGLEVDYTDAFDDGANPHIDPNGVWVLRGRAKTHF